jgi:hypothetical protein
MRLSNIGSRIVATVRSVLRLQKSSGDAGLRAILDGAAALHDVKTSPRRSGVGAGRDSTANMVIGRLFDGLIDPSSPKVGNSKSAASNEGTTP